MRCDEELKIQRPERATVISHDRHRGQHLTRCWIDFASFGEGVAEQCLVLFEGELDSGDRVVLVRGRGDMEGVLVFRLSWTSLVPQCL